MIGFIAKLLAAALGANTATCQTPERQHHYRMQSNNHVQDVTLLPNSGSGEEDVPTSLAVYDRSDVSIPQRQKEAFVKLAKAFVTVTFSSNMTVRQGLITVDTVPKVGNTVQMLITDEGKMGDLRNAVLCGESPSGCKMDVVMKTGDFVGTSTGFRTRASKRVYGKLKRFIFTNSEVQAVVDRASTDNGGETLVPQKCLSTYTCACSIEATHVDDSDEDEDIATGIAVDDQVTLEGCTAQYVVVAVFDKDDKNDKILFLKTQKERDGEKQSTRTFRTTGDFTKVKSESGSESDGDRRKLDAFDTDTQVDDTDAVFATEEACRKELICKLSTIAEEEECSELES